MKDLSTIPHGIKCILIKTDNKEKYTCILSICNADFRFSISRGCDKNVLSVDISKLCGGYTEISGICAVTAEDNNSYSAVRKAHLMAINKRLITTDFKENKKYPEMLEYLGWCSWNALYHENKLTSLHEDCTKFRSGLSKTVSDLKNNFSVEWVGVWHSFTAYWFGIDSTGKLYDELKDKLKKTTPAFIFPQQIKAITSLKCGISI